MKGKHLWMAVSRFIGTIMGFILLAVLWVVVFGLYAIVWKIVHAAARRETGSTWIAVSPVRDPHHLERQF